jgi:hypothetical protein
LPDTLQACEAVYCARKWAIVEEVQPAWMVFLSEMAIALNSSYTGAYLSQPSFCDIIRTGSSYEKLKGFMFAASNEKIFRTNLFDSLPRHC